MVVQVDLDGDGEPEARFPLKWAALALLLVCPSLRFAHFLQ